MSPAAVQEIGGLVAGSLVSIHGNLGRVKHLFNASSQPANGAGVAHFKDMGFIRHGPAGEYTLTFALAGIHLGVETAPITVQSSVARVDYYTRNPMGVDHYGANVSQLYGSGESDAWVLETSDRSRVGAPPPRTVASICNWPTCRPTFGTSAGFFFYGEELRDETLDVTFDAPVLPSGALSYAPTLLVVDALGRPLAGKSAMPLLNTSAVEIVEMPYTGASVSKLQVPRFVASGSFKQAQDDQTQASSGESGDPNSLGDLSELSRNEVGPLAGALVMFQEISVTDDPRSQHATLTSDFGSFVRVVVSPRGHSVARLQFLVEGVLAGSARLPNSSTLQDANDMSRSSTELHVYNLDGRSDNTSLRPPGSLPASDLCAYLRIVEQPSHVVQDSATRPIQTGGDAGQIHFRKKDGTLSTLKVQAVNSFGDHVSTMSVGMYAADSLGYTMYTCTDGQNLGLRTSYTDFLKRAGGGAGLTWGQEFASLFKFLLHAPAVSQGSDARGIAEFSAFTLRRSQNTWMKFAFVARDNASAVIKHSSVLGGEDDGRLSQYLAPASVCVSQYSDAVTIESIVESLEWVNADGSVFDPDTETLEVHDGWDILSVELPAIPDLPLIRLNGHNGTALAPDAAPPVNMFAITDELMLEYPAQVGLLSFEYGPQPSDEYIEIVKSNLGYAKNLTKDEDRLLDQVILDAIQVASFSASVPAVLGAVAEQWLSDGAPDDFSTYKYAEILSPGQVEAQSASLGSENSVIARLPTIRAVAGTPGDWSFVTMAGGVVSSAPIHVHSTDPVDSIALIDWPMTGECPRAWLSNTNQTDEFVDGNLLLCPGNNNCSDHGKCTCGVCICAGGWDGAVDCSEPYSGDSFASFFQNDPVYGSKYGGLPVYEVKTTMGENAARHDPSADFFSRFFLPKQVVVGRLKLRSAEHEGMRQSIAIKSASSILSDSATLVPARQQVGDVVNEIRVGALLNSTLRPLLPGYSGTDYNEYFEMSVPPRGDFSVVPALISCSGEPVYGWAFTSATSGCLRDLKPVASIPLGSSGSSDFDAYDYFGDIDHRLVLSGVPTGCYRFKFTYAPRGPGSRARHAIDDPLSNAQAVSIGAGRPFRVLSPVRSIEFRSIYEDCTVPRDRHLPVDIEIYLNIRNEDSGLTDACSNAELTDKVSTTNRCPPTPKDGLDVTVTAVSIATGAEYSLYVAGQFSDCARTEPLDPGSDDEFGFLERNVYRVNFSAIQFPSVPSDAPDSLSQGSNRVESSAMPAGVYRLRFSSYGTKVDADFRITLVDAATEIGAFFFDLRFVFPNDGNYSLGLLPDVNSGAVYGPDSQFESFIRPWDVSTLDMDRNNAVCDSEFPLFFAQAAVAIHPSSRREVPADSWLYGFESKEVGYWFALFFQESSIWIPAEGVQVSMDILYGPPNSNAQLIPGATTLAADAEGFVESCKAGFSAGAPGLYILSFSTDDVAEPAVVAVNLTNSIARVDARFSAGGGDVAGIPALPPAIPTAPWSPRVRAVQGEAVAQPITYCAAFQLLSGYNATLRPAPLRLIVRLVIPPSDEQLSVPVPPTPSSGSNTSTLNSTEPGPKETEPVWLRAMRATAPHPLVLGASDSRNDLQMGVLVTWSNTDTITGAFHGGTGQLNSMSIVTGSDGCVTLSALTFTTLAASTRVRLVVSLQGIEAPGIDIEVLTLKDARPVSLSQLQERVFVPLLTSLPLFGANSAALPVPARFACVVAGFASLAAMAGTDGLRFVQEYDNLRFVGVYADADTAYVFCLNVAWMLALVMVGFYTFVAAVVLWPSCAYWARNQTKHAGTCGRKIIANKSLGGRVEVVTGRDDAQQRGFFASWTWNAFVYTRARLPRLGPYVPAVPADATVKRLYEGKAPAASKSFAAWIADCAHAILFLENAEEAFSLPLRLLSAAVVSALCCLLLVMYVLYLCGHLREYAEAALVAILAVEARAIRMLLEGKMREKDALANSVTAAMSWTTRSDKTSQATSAGEAAAAAAAKVDFRVAIDAALSVGQAVGVQEGGVNGMQLPKDLAGVLAEAQNSGLITEPLGMAKNAAAQISSAASGDTLIAELTKRQTELITPYLEVAVANTRQAAIVGLFIAALFVFLNWLHLLYTYKRIVLSVRRNDKSAMPSTFQWDREAAHPAAAVDYIGIQAAGTAVSMAVVTFVISALYLLCSLPFVQEWGARYALGALGALMGASFAIAMTRLLLLRYVAASKGRISLRRCFSFLDLYFTFFNLVTGIVVALVRAVISLLGFMSIIMRPDIPVAALPRSDPAAKAFCSMLLLDSTFNNPIFAMACEPFTASLNADRAAAASRVRPCNGSGTNVATFVANPLGAGSATLVDSSARKMRVRNRFWLYAMLAAHPELIEYRCVPLPLVSSPRQCEVRSQS